MSESVSQPVLDTAAGVALTACRSLERDSPVCVQVVVILK